MGVGEEAGPDVSGGVGEGPPILHDGNRGDAVEDGDLAPEPLDRAERVEVAVAPERVERDAGAEVALHE